MWAGATLINMKTVILFGSKNIRGNFIFIPFSSVTWNQLKKYNPYNQMKIIRVFPRKTNASPKDNLTYFGPPDLFAEADEIHISVSFTWDIPYSEWLMVQWERIAPVKMGGPAFNKPGGVFQPGMYLAKGYVITSRGCPNKCWFCSVWKRESGVNELPITEGNNVLDDNLLACSDSHIQKVFEMLSYQKKVQFTGGLEAKRLKNWHINWFTKLSIDQMFFAYDTIDDYEPLLDASKMLKDAGYNWNVLRCYVLIGFPRDSFKYAEERLKQVLDLGMMPMAMLYRNDSGNYDQEWRRFQGLWARPAIINYRIKKRQIMTIP